MPKFDIHECGASIKATPHAAECRSSIMRGTSTAAALAPPAPGNGETEGRLIRHLLEHLKQERLDYEKIGDRPFRGYRED